MASAQHQLVIFLPFAAFPRVPTTAWLSLCPPFADEALTVAVAGAAAAGGEIELLRLLERWFGASEKRFLPAAFERTSVYPSRRRFYFRHL